MDDLVEIVDEFNTKMKSENNSVDDLQKCVSEILPKYDIILQTIGEERKDAELNNSIDNYIKQLLIKKQNVKNYLHILNSKN